MVKKNKNLIELLIGLNYNLLCGDVENVTINKLCFDTRKIEKDDLFVCIKGADFDSHSKLSEISEMGAKVIVVDIKNEYVEGATINEGTIIIAVNDTRIALAVLSNNYFYRPSDDMKIIGITGTKGKTTTAFMIKSILEHDGFKVGMIGTIGVYYGDIHIETSNTTPESYNIHEYFAKMKDEGIQYVVMEVSSQSLKYNRVHGIRFSYAVWTNISPEHIGTNEHDDFDDYLNSKLKIFEQSNCAIINLDSEHIDEVTEACKKNKTTVIVKRDNIDIKLNMPGKYNIENASLAYRVGIAIGISERVILKALKETVVPGRCEVVYKNDDIEVIVDFAHEKNGAENFLKTMKEYVEGTNRRIVVIFGCGGNRAKERRYGMGEVVGKLADFVIVTADNSRNEKTLDIISDIESTLSKYKEKDDMEKGYIIKELRIDAIRYAIEKHKKGDLICVIGKGHETTNEANGVKTHFSDREEILKIVG